jgi:putative FmdB family regulatory protein
MPIYAYKCASCGFAKDVLQKISDAPLTGCPQCGAQAFSKQITAAGFQLKGSGWYATDFRGGSKTKPETASDTDTAKTESKPAESKSAESKPADSKPADSPKSGPPSAAGSRGASCT